MRIFLITTAFAALLGVARAQTSTTSPSISTTTSSSIPTTPSPPTDTTAIPSAPATSTITIQTPPTTAVPTFHLPTRQRTTSQSTIGTTPTTADKINEENRMLQDRAAQPLRQQDSRGLDRRSQSVCLQNDTQCLKDEARARVNQNNSTQKDNPTDLNNRPTY